MDLLLVGLDLLLLDLDLLLMDLAHLLEDLDPLMMDSLEALHPWPLDLDLDLSNFFLVNICIYYIIYLFSLSLTRSACIVVQ